MNDRGDVPRAQEIEAYLLRRPRKTIGDKIQCGKKTAVDVVLVFKRERQGKKRRDSGEETDDGEKRKAVRRKRKRKEYPHRCCYRRGDASALRAPLREKMNERCLNDADRAERQNQCQRRAPKRPNCGDCNPQHRGRKCDRPHGEQTPLGSGAKRESLVVDSRDSLSNHSERGRFELPRPVKVCSLSKRVHSTTLPPLQGDGVPWLPAWGKPPRGYSPAPLSRDNFRRYTRQRLLATVRSLDLPIRVTGRLHPFRSWRATVSAGMLGTDDPPAIRSCEALIAEAIERGASDIHLEPRFDGGLARMRIDGLLHDGTAFEPVLYERVVTRIKLLGGIDIAERRRPQDGRFSAGAFDIRIATMPLLDGERVTARLQANDARLPGLDTLGFASDMLHRFRALVRAPQGLVIACGPTGSGKTTTIYSALAERVGKTESLCSIEDPVEIRMPGINQVQVHEKAGLTFASALRGLLRHDPDIIFVGEIRDGETAELAARAALCGRLVVSTLHATDAWSARMRMLDLGLADRFVDAAVTAFLSQRLLRRVRRDGSYAGRIGIFELIEPRALVARSLSEASHPLRLDAARHVREGRSTAEEVERVLGASH